MISEDIAFHEVFVDNEYVTHEAVVRTVAPWLGLDDFERWHSVKFVFDTLDGYISVKVGDIHKFSSDFRIQYTGKCKSEIKAMTMLEVLDWLETL